MLSVLFHKRINTLFEGLVGAKTILRKAIETLRVLVGVISNLYHTSSSATVELPLIPLLVAAIVVPLTALAKYLEVNDSETAPAGLSLAGCANAKKLIVQQKTKSIFFLIWAVLNL